jgi:Flp pilus assembly pilin Flp
MTLEFLRNERGAGAVEFALAAPVMLSMVIGVAQLGTLFQANAGIQHAIEEAARVAAVYPTPDNVEDLVLAKLEASRFGMTGTLTPEVEEGEADDGMKVLDISLSYAVPLDFIFFKTPPVTLSHSRRVFLQEAYSGSDEDEDDEEATAEPPADSSGGGTSSGADSSGGATTSSGSTTPTSSGSTTPTSSGSTTPTSSGSTTPTSSGSTTPTSSGSTTPTSSGNASSGNGSSGNGSSGNTSGGNTSSGNGNGGTKTKDKK